VETVALDENRQAAGATDTRNDHGLGGVDVQLGKELYIAASTAKSPQPGHQIGLASVLYSLAGMNGMMMFL
jgi:hypothetical protein